MGIVFEDDTIVHEGDSKPTEIDEHALRRVRRAAEHLCDLAMKSSWTFQLFMPSTVAIACVVSARMANSI